MLKKIIIIGLCTIILILVYGTIENTLIVKTELSINGKLKDVLTNKVVIHLSDLHIGSIGRKEKDLLKRIDNIQPDIIFLTGDYVKLSGDYEPAMKFLSKLEAEIGIWAVMGDYDYSNNRKSCLFCHDSSSGSKAQVNKVKFLKNTGEIIQVNGKKIQIFGIDEINLKNKKIKGIVSKLDYSLPLIVLSHNPLNFNLFDNYQEVLMLAGDTHGGQLPLPSWLWGILGYEKNKQYNYGLFRDKSKQMFVTRGIGTSHFPVRFFCPPEIVVFKF